MRNAKITSTFLDLSNKIQCKCHDMYSEFIHLMIFAMMIEMNNMFCFI